MVSIYNGILFNHKREWSSDNATTCMSLENIILSEETKGLEVIWSWGEREIESYCLTASFCLGVM